MAKVIFDASEMKRIDAICAELDPASDELMVPHLERLEAGPRSEVIGYFRQALRAELIMGLLARAVASAALSLKAADPLGASSMIDSDYDDRYFVLGVGPTEMRANLWQYNFSYPDAKQHQAYWLCRESDAFPPSAFRSFFSLLDLAHDRMFPETVDDWAESLS